MNTNNVYYGVLRVSTHIDHKGDYLSHEGLTTITHSEPLKPVLVLMKQSFTGKIIIKDLNTKEKYMTKIPLKSGKLFIKLNQLLPFSFENNVPNKLSKKQILKIGNENLKEVEKALIYKNDK